MLCALIMAGGKGTRFWPLSTEDKPKQFLKLINDETMIQMTVNRIKPIIPMERIFICTGKKYVSLVKEQLPEINDMNIIVEPEGRNTAPCIALSALMIERRFKDANMVVLPSDHLIRDEDEFRNTLLAADSFLQNNDKAIVTLGINPTRAEVGYGYIKYTDEVLNAGDFRVIKVDAFKEKPNKETAKRYLTKGNYLWNGGMFIWSINNIINQIKMYSPDTYEALHLIREVDDERLQELINEKYSHTEAISIDYAVLEKSKDVYVIPSNFGWDDVGSWEAIERYRESDEFGNIILGAHKTVNCKNNLIVSNEETVVVEGLSNIYVIQNEGKIIVGSKDNVSNVKELRAII